MLNDSALLKYLIAEAGKPFLGWDFSYITRKRRMVESPASWNYIKIIMKKMKKVTSMLDMGTGGGELLSSLRPLPKKSIATEGYQPNIKIAKKRLKPFGVKVVSIKNPSRLPFPDDYFELIINRHESYAAKEVFRVLKPGGLFITEQVGGFNMLDLNRMLGAKKDYGIKHWILKHSVKGLVSLGFRIIDQKEEFPQTRFYDIGAVVYYLKAIPWQIPDFSVRKYFRPLKKIYYEIQKKGYIEVKSHRFFIMAKKILDNLPLGSNLHT